MSIDDLVNLRPDTDGLLEGDDDLHVASDIVLGEHAAEAVLEPLLTDLVAADVEVPVLLGDPLEALVRVDVYHTVLVFRMPLGYLRHPRANEVGDELLQLRQLHEVQSDLLTTSWVRLPAC